MRKQIQRAIIEKSKNYQGLKKLENKEKNILNTIKEINPEYQLLRLVGEGSIGSVYECKDADNKKIAVKLMAITPMIDPRVFEGIIKVAKATNSLAKKVNVVKVISAGKTKNFYYICMDMIEGSTLEEIVNDSNIPLEKKVKIAKEVAEILAAIHAKSIVHQDLKPSNILIDKNGTPFLNDFYLFHTQRHQKFSAMPQGTPFYMSPEQTGGQRVTALTDFYSFGVLLYEMLTGSIPYEKRPKNISDMIGIVNEGKIIPPSQKNNAISPILEAIILKLLERDPKMRYQKMETLAKDLQAYLDGKPISITTHVKKSIFDKFLNYFAK